jgi:hypothetical protein
MYKKYSVIKTSYIMNTQNYPAIKLIIFITANACDMTPIAYIFLLYFSLFHKHHFILLAELQQ